MKIGIVGAGIGGLAAAALLARAGHEVMLCDRFDRPRPVGSGLMIQPVGLAVLDRCGAGAAARGHGRRIARMLGREVSGRRVLDVTYDRAGREEAQGLAIHRAALHAALLEAAEARGVTVRASAQVTGAPLEGGRRWIALQGERLGPFDLVVDASGAGSVLSPLKARALSFGAIWGTVPWPDATDLPDNHLSQRYSRADRMAGVLPVGRLPGDPRAQAAVFWSLPRTAIDAWRAAPLEEWRADAVGLWPAMAPFVEQVRDHAQMSFAQYSHGTLRRPWDEALVFIGDAAHRASPQLGQGANMALLDALALHLALARATGEDALRAYAQMRRWHVRLYQGMSAAFTPQYQSGSRVLPVLRDWCLAPLSLTPPLPHVLSRLVAGRLVPPLAGVDFP